MILLDTHVVLWLALEPARISKAAKAEIEAYRSSGQGLAISDITLFEIAIVERKGRIQLNSSLEKFLAEIETRFIVLPITSQVCVQTMRLPEKYPADPADRIIGATAMVNSASLITADHEIRRSKIVKTVW